jgi:signal peptidase I
LKRRTHTLNERPTYAPWILCTRRVLLRLIVIALVWIWVMPRAVGGLNTYTVVSGISMEPTFHTGDLIISRKAKQYKVGDVVTYKIPDEKYKKFPIVHRVIGRTKDGVYEIQGDNQDHPDSWSIPATNIVGTKVFMIPKGGFALGYARNPIGLALLFGALVTWTFWPKRNEDETESNPLLAPCDLSALLCRDASDDQEPLVVGTSLTYAQFLNRPTLRHVVQAQASGLPKSSTIPNPTDAILETVPEPVPKVLSTTVRGTVEGTVEGTVRETVEEVVEGTVQGMAPEAPSSALPTPDTTTPQTHEGAPPVDLKTFSVESIESPHSGSLFDKVQPEQHLADWATPSAQSAQSAQPARSVEPVTVPTEAVMEFADTNAIAKIPGESDGQAIDDGPTPNFAEAWGFDDDEPATSELTTSKELTSATGSFPSPESRSDDATPVPGATPSATQPPQPTVDELLERWINDEADAPLPDELFVTT